jgi:hypothetical protein
MGNFKMITDPGNVRYRVDGFQDIFILSDELSSTKFTVAGKLFVCAVKLMSLTRLSVFIFLFAGLFCFSAGVLYREHSFDTEVFHNLNNNNRKI